MPGRKSTSHPLSHVEIAEIVTRFVLRRLDGDERADPQQFGELVSDLIGAPKGESD